MTTAARDQQTRMTTPATLADYVQQARAIHDARVAGEGIDLPRVRVAVAASFTVKGLSDVLVVKSTAAGLSADVYVSGYGQALQELLDADGALYSRKPDLIVIFREIGELLGRHADLPYEWSDADRKQWVDETLSGLRDLVANVKGRTRATVLLHNFEVPSYSPLGVLENKQSFGITETVETLNAGLRAAFRDDPQVFVFDYERFCASVGKSHLRDDRLYYAADVRVGWDVLPALCDEYLAYLLPLAARTRKCIVLDLDNTLWGGVVGEDGPDGIALGPTPQGRPYVSFQQRLLALHQRGIVLAINSKNNADEAMHVLREHPSMVLREGHFAAMRINWQGKVTNLVELAAELQLGLDSFVVFDDDKPTRQLIRDALPEVLVVELPDDPALYAATLSGLTVFNTLQLTREDERRGQLYQAQRTRRDLAQSFSDLTAYLASLNTIVTIQKAESSTVPRLAQLTQKTNQFNVTTRRYREEDIERMAADPACLVLSARVEDRFGDSGITALTIVQKGTPSWRIDTFLLSCRVIGRGIEDALLAQVFDDARRAGAGSVTGKFIPTRKNAPAADFYRRSGFDPVRTEDGTEVWEYDLRRPSSAPSFIRVIAVH